MNNHTINDPGKRGRIIGKSAKSTQKKPKKRRM
jgi:hypothetical protein